jgi:hypothetical protein
MSFHVFFPLFTIFLLHRMSYVKDSDLCHYMDGFLSKLMQFVICIKATQRLLPSY